MMEIDTPGLAAVGVVLVVATFADLVWTAIAVGQRRGPISDAVARSVSALGRMGSAGHGRRRAIGVVTAVAIPAVWLMLLWAGFALMCLSDDDAVLVAASQQPVGALGRIAYAAGGLAGAGAGLIAGLPRVRWSELTGICMLLETGEQDGKTWLPARVSPPGPGAGRVRPHRHGRGLGICRSASRPSTCGAGRIASTVGSSPD